MEQLFNKLEFSKHIVVVLDADSSINMVASCSAIYTYCLQLHKKVTFYSDGFKLPPNLKFLPWVDKLKTSYPSSADVEIKAICSYTLFNYFYKSDIKINQKMATSLYAGILDFSDGFKRNISSKLFEIAKILVESGADVGLCTKNLLNFNTLADLRLKSILLDKMILKDEAKVGYIELLEDDMKKSGADIGCLEKIAYDILSLPTVEVVKISYENNILEFRS